jgi:hypothetical protein
MKTIPSKCIIEEFPGSNEVIKVTLIRGNQQMAGVGMKLERYGLHKAENANYDHANEMIRWQRLHQGTSYCD